MKWFKFYGQEYLSDPKILTLTACERSCWITLLSYASVNDNENDNGMITFLSEHHLMIQSGINPASEEWETTKGVLEKFEKLKMITLDNADDNAKITILNWQKRQETSLTGYERVKRYREKKQIDNADDNAKITSDKIRRDKKRIDKIREERGVAEKISATPAEKAREFFQDQEKVISLLLVKGLNEQIVRREIVKFVSYWTEPNKSGTKVKWEMQPTFDVPRRLATWFGRIKEYQNNKYQINL